MKCLPALLFFVLLSSLAAGQGVGYIDSIANNPVEYRRLLDKFARGEERLTVEESVTVYYGYAEQDYYTGDHILGEAEMQEYILRGDFETAYVAGSQVLERCPVNLTALYWTLAAATETGKSWEVRNSLKTRYNNVTFAIAGSGDGLAQGTAFRVIFTGDIYIYCMEELGIDMGGAERYLLDGRYEAFVITPTAKFNHREIYFDDEAAHLYEAQLRNE
jgi:hypothetical protein